MRALSVRQPFAEQIMAGRKRVEYRSLPTNVRGRIYVYASLRPASPEGEHLPQGLIVGSVELFDCKGGSGWYRWLLRAPKRLAKPRKPRTHPQPVWFNPFP
jgi:hypothetical protein